MADPRAISTGVGRGEAVVFKESSFDPIDFSERLVARQDAKARQQQQEMEESQALLSDRVKSQWDTDTYNYFQPRVEELRKTIMDTISQKKGRLSGREKMTFKQAWEDLKTEAEVSNATFKAYQRQAQLLDQDLKTGSQNFDLEESRRNLKILENPMSNPETAQEVQQIYGGNVLKWRADNAEKYGLVPSYSRESYIMDLTKGKGFDEQLVYKKDDKGGFQYTKTPQGGYMLVGEKGVTDPQLKVKVEEIWSGKDWRSKKTREQDMETVSQKFVFDEMGRPVVRDESDAVAVKTLENANLKGKVTKDEIIKELAKAYTYTDLRQRFPLEERLTAAPKGFAPRQSSGKGFDDRYTKTTTDYKLGDANIAVSLPGQTWVNQVSKKGHKIRRVSLETKGKAGDTESLQLNIAGKPVRPISYLVDDTTGEVFMEYSTREQTGVNPMTNTPIYSDKVSAQPVGQNIWGNIAGHYGYGDKEGGVQAFKREVLGMKTSGDKPKQEGQDKSKKTYSKADWAKLPLAERRKLLQQGIKPQ